MSLSAKELGVGAPWGTLGTWSVLVTGHCHTGKGQHETSLTSKEKRKGYIYTYVICCFHTACLFSLSPAVRWLEASQLWQSLQSVSRSKVPRAWKVDARITVRGKTLKEDCPQIPLPYGTSLTTSCFPWITPMQILTSKGLFSNKTNHNCHCRKTNHLINFKESFWILKIVSRSFRMSFYNALF